MTNKGWECSKCGRSWAPFALECQACNRDRCAQGNGATCNNPYCPVHAGRNLDVAAELARINEQRIAGVSIVGTGPAQREMVDFVRAVTPDTPGTSSRAHHDTMTKRDVLIANRARETYDEMQAAVAELAAETARTTIERIDAARKSCEESAPQVATVNPYGPGACRMCGSESCGGCWRTMGTGQICVIPGCGRFALLDEFRCGPCRDEHLRGGAKK
jgi:hypothetical protein